MDDGHDDRMFRAFLMENDVRCPGCGYSLSDLMEYRCPECGERFSLEMLDADEMGGADEHELQVIALLHRGNLIVAAGFALIFLLMSLARLGAGGTWGFSPELSFLYAAGYVVFEFVVVKPKLIESLRFGWLFNPITVLLSLLVVAVATALMGFR